MDDREKMGIAVIANPLAGEKLTQKCLKLVTKASEGKHIFRGVKEVVKALRKKEAGICFIAGNVTPLDVITHLPVLCEEADVPYIYVPSKEALGSASLTKRPAAVIMVKPKDGADHMELMKKVEKAVAKMTPTL